MVFSPPDAAEVWQHKKDIQSRPPIDPSTSKRFPSKKVLSPLKLNPPRTPNSTHSINTAKSILEPEVTPGPPKPSPKESPRRLQGRAIMSTTESTKLPKVRRNVWSARIADGKDRSHITPMTKKELGIRITQGVLATIFLVLTSFSAFTLNFGNLAGFGLSFFVFSLTATYFILYAVTVISQPILYHWIAHIVFESLLFIFWLAAWATLASYASVLNLAGAGRSSTQQNATSIGRRERPMTSPPPTGGPAGPAASTGQVTSVTTSTSSTAEALTASTVSEIQAAKIIIGVSAGLGAIIWVLFGVTLAITIINVLRHRNTKKGKDTEMSGGVA